MTTTTNLNLAKPEATENVDVSVLNENFDKIDGAVNEIGNKVIDSGWINPTLTNGWKKYNDSFYSPQYRKIGKQVFLRGMVVGGTTDTSCYTLPSGYRPQYHVFIFEGNGSSYVQITPNGNVLMKGVTANQYMSMDGMSFFVD